MADLTPLKLVSPDREYVAKYNSLVDFVGSYTLPMPHQQHFVVGVSGQSSVNFVLAAAPINGICIISIDGYVVHHYAVAGNIVTSTEAAQPGEDVMITYWAIQNV